MTKRVKWNFKNWFEGEVLENINTRDKLLKIFKKSRLDIDKNLYKKAKYIKINRSKKRAFFYDKLSEYTGKPKELMGNFKISRHAKENTNFKFQCSWK